MVTLLSGSFFFQEGSSDREYELKLVEGDGVFSVIARWGRRGNLGKPTAKFMGMDEAAARKAFDAEVQERAKKRYVGTVVGGGSAPVAVAQSGEASGHLPILLNAIDESEATRLLSDDAYVMQQKYDGHRRALLVEKGVARGINRLGQFVGVSESLAAALTAPGPDFLVDGELIGGTFYAFDLLELDGMGYHDMPYLTRLASLATLTGLGPDFVIVETAVTTEGKTAMLERLKAMNAEGAVYKLARATYQAGRPNSGGPQLKYKLWQSASCVVTGINAKRSIAVATYDGDSLVPVGNVTIPPDKAVPEVGDLVEIRYLDFYVGGSMTQPTYLGKRDDIVKSECVLSQLRKKAA